MDKMTIKYKKGTDIRKYHDEVLPIGIITLEHLEPREPRPKSKIMIKLEELEKRLELLEVK